MAENLLPHNDPDLLLAHQLDSYNQTGIRPETVDPLFDILISYKRECRKVADTQVMNSKSVWDAIAVEMESHSKEKAKIFSITPAKLAWAAAAIILIISFAGIFYFSTSSNATLIASSEQQINTTTLSDGSTVTLRPHTKLFALAKSESKRSYKLEGEAYFEVTSDPDRAFSVEAGSGTITVLGTKFNLSSWGNQTQVFLEEGSVKLTSPPVADSVILKPGQSAAINEQNSIEHVETVSADNFTDWMNNEIIFTNRSTGYIFRELEQQFNIEITAPDSILTISLSGGISLENRTQSLNDLGKVLGGSFSESPTGSFTFTSNN